MTISYVPASGMSAMTWYSPASSGWTIGRSGPTPSVGSVSSTVGVSTGTSGWPDGSRSVRSISFCPARAGTTVYMRRAGARDSGSSTASARRSWPAAAARRRRRDRRAVHEHGRDPDDRQQHDQLDGDDGAEPARRWSTGCPDRRRHA